MQWLFSIISRERTAGALMDLDEWGPIYFPSWISRPLKRPHPQWHFFARNSLKEDWRVTKWGLIVFTLVSINFESYLLLSFLNLYFCLLQGGFQCHRFSKEYKVRRIERCKVWLYSQEPDIEKGGATKGWNRFNGRPTPCVTCLHIPPSQER